MNAWAGQTTSGSEKCAKLATICAAWFLFFLATSLAAAQQYDQSRDDTSGNKTDVRKHSATSELAKSNLTRVAASAGQIREVLVKDVGLLVELKRWIARDAANSGQVVEDSGLTDEAIFERLERDVEFR